MEARPLVRLLGAVEYIRALRLGARAETKPHEAIHSKHWAPVHEQRGARDLRPAKNSGMHQLYFETS